jgi:hypothetical protein
MTKLHDLTVWVYNQVSEIREPGKPFPDPGSRDQKGTGSRIRNTARFDERKRANNQGSLCSPTRSTAFLSPPTDK